VSTLDRRQVLRILGTIGAAGVTGAAGGCAAGANTERIDNPSGVRIRLGLMAPATGPYAGVGKDITLGFELFLNSRRDRLGPYPVDLLIEDEGATPASARAAVDALLKEEIIAIAGVASPGALTAIRDTVEKARVPVVSATASPRSLGSTTYIWRASYVDGDAGRAIAPYAAAKFARVYLLYDETDTAQSEVDEFRNGFTANGGSIVGDVHTSGAFDSRLDAVRFSGADALFCAYAGESAWRLLTAYRDAKLSMPLIGPGSLTETSRLVDLLDNGRKLPNRVLTAMNYAPDLDNDANRRFASAFFSANGIQPTAYAMAAYDTAAILDTALRLVGDELTPAALNRAFNQLGQLDSPRGTWTFTANRTPQQKWYLRELRLDGQLPANLVASDLDTLT
jgi:branched-chain amino acid transport system substrate-binding protein